MFKPVLFSNYYNTNLIILLYNIIHKYYTFLSQLCKQEIYSTSLDVNEFRSYTFLNQHTKIRKYEKGGLESFV